MLLIFNRLHRTLTRNTLLSSLNHLVSDAEAGTHHGRNGDTRTYKAFGKLTPIWRLA